MNWKKDYKKIETEREALYADIQRIEKRIQQLGPRTAGEYIAFMIEKQYGFPCRIRHNGKTAVSLVMYKKDASRKQIQYNREESIIGSLLLTDCFDPQISTSKNGCDPLPETLDGVFGLLSSKRGTVNEVYYN